MAPETVQRIALLSRQKPQRNLEVDSLKEAFELQASSLLSTLPEDTFNEEWPRQQLPEVLRKLYPVHAGREAFEVYAQFMHFTMADKISISDLFLEIEVFVPAPKDGMGVTNFPNGWPDYEDALEDLMPADFFCHPSFSDINDKNKWLEAIGNSPRNIRKDSRTWEYFGSPQKIYPL